jgi:integrase
MSRRSLGPRLYLRAGRVDSRTGGRLPDLFYIRDGAIERGTGCGPDRRAGAEQALAAYIAEKWSPPAITAESACDPAQVHVADVLALYARERAPKLADPVATGARLKPLLAWWGPRKVADIRRSTCQAYLAHRMKQPIASFRGDPARARKVTEQGARRELEDLSAAIGHWCGEHALQPRPKVWMPEKTQGGREALTRAQAADLLRAARGYRKGKGGAWTPIGGSAAANRRHLVRFILLGLYTGTRPGVLPRLLWAESPIAPWVDLDAGVVYRRGKAEKDHKTKRRPLVKLPRRLAAHLARWRRLDLAWHEQLRTDGIDPPATVLHHGANALSGRIRRGFAGCVADAGLPAEVTPHWLRHTCATWLMEAGCEPWEAAGYTGMTVAVLEKHYAHHRADHQQTARDALGGRR